MLFGVHDDRGRLLYAGHVGPGAACAPTATRPKSSISRPEGMSRQRPVRASSPGNLFGSERSTRSSSTASVVASSPVRVA
ncbi:hypothetical protein CF166_13155 [Amycolatopsis sp. KNN50.9b]|nr:hypothetical protein CF166_13155 [Amycolatopsis sp. KNN50.9b]